MNCSAYGQHRLPSVFKIYVHILIAIAIFGCLSIFQVVKNANIMHFIVCHLSLWLNHNIKCTMIDFYSRLTAIMCIYSDTTTIDRPFVNCGCVFGVTMCDVLFVSSSPIRISKIGTLCVCVCATIAVHMLWKFYTSSQYLSIDISIYFYQGANYYYTTIHSNQFSTKKKYQKNAWQFNVMLHNSGQCIVLWKFEVGIIVERLFKMERMNRINKEKRRINEKKIKY